MKCAQSLIIAILILVFAPAAAFAGEEVKFISSQDDGWGDDDGWGEDDWGDGSSNNKKKDDGWGDDDWGDGNSKKKKKEDDSWGDHGVRGTFDLNKIWGRKSAGGNQIQKTYLGWRVPGLGAMGGDLRAGLVYVLAPDDEQTHHFGFDLAAGIYINVLGLRVANFFHFESAFGIGETQENQYRFGFRHDILYHSVSSLNWGVGGSFAIFQIAATSHDNEVMWAPELAAVVDVWHFYLRVPVQFYAGSENGVGFGPSIGGYIQ